MFTIDIWKYGSRNLKKIHKVTVNDCSVLTASQMGLTCRLDELMKGIRTVDRSSLYNFRKYI